MNAQLEPISATAISHYIRLEKCPRYLRFRLRRDELKELVGRYPEFEIIEQPLTPLLREAGLQFEEQVIKSLPGATIDLRSQDAAATMQTIAALPSGETCYLTQAAVEGEIGGWPCVGRADLVRVTRLHDDQLDLMVADIKASRKDRVEHRLQVAFYLRLLSGMLAEANLRIAERAGAVLKMADDGSLPTLYQPESMFDLQPYDIILSQLMEGEGSDLSQIANADFDDLNYSLGYKCDSCLFNQLCMVDSAQRGDVALVPYSSASEISLLRTAGVRTLHQLAELKTLPGPTDWNTEFPTTPGQEEIVAALKASPTVSPGLDRLVQRARATARQFDPGIKAYSHLLDGSFSQLPADEANPDLVKVFLDAQHDYVQDRIYLVGALVQGPKGSVPVVHISPGPPNENDEEKLLLDLLNQIVEKVRKVARDYECAPVHLYVYDSYDQKVWLQALGRHLEALSSVPAFYDLLTSSPALGQGMVSSLAAEVRNRRNLGITCQNLYSVAARLGFKWKTQLDNFMSLFYLRVFDNRKQRADGVWVERASRFNSHIPLEYAYGAWDVLPDDPSNLGLITFFRRCTPEAIVRFQSHRLNALAHVEGALKGKSKQLIKEPLQLGAFAQQSAPDEGLSRSLAEFLSIEHHSASQERLLLFSMPIERRAQAGRALLLQCLRVEKPGRDIVARFAIEFRTVGLDPVVAMQAMRIKEGDWMVLNPYDGRSPWRVPNGRIAIVEAIEGQEISLRLLGLTNRGSEFKFYHDARLQPVPEELYTLDEMSDDLNAGKQMEALRHAPDNVLYQQLTAQPGLPILTPVAGRTRQLLDRIQELQPGNRSTIRQQEVIAAYIPTPLLCVQGPPGTGKTSTLGWSVLARLLARDERPLRVAVCARTHKATNLVLESISSKLHRLATTREGRALGQVNMYKVTSEGGDELPRGVRALNPYGATRSIEEAFTAQISIIGGTPGGLYSLNKRRSGSEIDWSHKLFDLVVIDEASQMGIPEALLAAAFLKVNGQMLIVGDHRQMPPILAHEWKDEMKRSAIAHRPHRSIFETLVEGGFPTVRLDESFRLHTVHAGFLAEHIYKRDGIPFHSRRTQVLPALRGEVDEYVAAALRSDYPVVVIEHTETASQQFNPLEIELATPLIAACLDDLGLDPSRGIGVVVPHRAQKAALRQRFPTLAAADAIDTVERFQGGERDVIIVSATASDPNYVLAEAGFLVNLNRLNVAISRARLKLIVIASTSVFRLLTDDLEIFEHALLWKQLRYKHATDPLWVGGRGGYSVSVFGRHTGDAGATAASGPVNATSIGTLPREVPIEVLTAGHPSAQQAVPSTPVLPTVPALARRERTKEKW